MRERERENTIVIKNFASMSERFMLIDKTKNMFIIAKEDIDRINCFSYKYIVSFL